MTTAIPNRRLSPQIIDQDVNSLNGLKTVTSYKTSRSEASSETQQAYQTMLTQRQSETEKLALYRAASDAARLAE